MPKYPQKLLPQVLCCSDGSESCAFPEEGAFQFSASRGRVHLSGALDDMRCLNREEEINRQNLCRYTV